MSIKDILIILIIKNLRFLEELMVYEGEVVQLSRIFGYLKDKKIGKIINLICNIDLMPLV